MFEQLWEEDPRVQEIMSRSEAKGEARGEAKGEARGMLKGKTEIVATLIATRFPTLAEEAQQKLQRVQRPETLDNIAKLTMTVPDEEMLRLLLDSIAA